MGQIKRSWGPFVSASAVTSTGAKAIGTPDGPLSSWSCQVTTAGSTSTVTAKYTLQGSNDPSTGTPTNFFTLSTGAGPTSVAFATGKPARYARIKVDALSSTSSTAPSLTGWLSGSA